MSSINNVFLCGYVGADAEVKEFSGTKIARFHLATSTGGYKKADGTEVKERTEWHSITCFRGLASLAEHVKKGMRVTVSGHITYNEVEKDGAKKIYTEIIADNLVLGEKKETPEPNDLPW